MSYTPMNENLEKAHQKCLEELDSLIRQEELVDQAVNAAINKFGRDRFVKAMFVDELKPLGWVSKTGHGTYFRESISPEHASLKFGDKSMWTPVFTENKVAMTDVRKLLKEAYMAGFMATGEGWNGEYPFEGQDPEDDPKWVEKRDNALKEQTNE